MNIVELAFNEYRERVKASWRAGEAQENHILSGEGLADAELVKEWQDATQAEQDSLRALKRAIIREMGD